MGSIASPSTDETSELAYLQRWAPNERTSLQRTWPRLLETTYVWESGGKEDGKNG